MSTRAEREQAARGLLTRCLSGFGAFINGRKMARPERDRLRRDIADFLDGAPARADSNVYAVKTEAYEPGDWYQAENVNDMQQFFLSRLGAIREAARRHGYAIGAHGSMRRDMDLIAVPWVEDVASPDVLAKAIAHAACGIARAGPYEWEKKPHGRIATSIPVCWVAPPARPNDGHIDLSVVTTKEPKEEHHAG